MNRPAALDGLPEAPPETLRDKLTYWQYRTLWGAVAGMPEPLARAAPPRLGALWYRLASSRQRSQVRANLARVAGGPPDDELDELVRAAYVSYVRYWIDAFRLHTYEPAEIAARSSEDNVDAIDELLAGGEGAILATAHLGSWDVGAMFAASRGWDMAVVAEVVEPRRLFERFVRLREGAGVEVCPLVPGGHTIRRMLEVVRRGGLPTLLADRDLSGNGQVVDFFGEPCPMPRGPAVLARRTGRPVAVGAFVTDGPDGWRGVVQDVVDVSGRSVADGTRIIAGALEELIARYPEQWHVFVPNWVADRRDRVADRQRGPEP